MIDVESVRSKLEVLEHAAQPLEPGAGERERVGGMAFDYVERFMAALADDDPLKPHIVYAIDRPSAFTAR